jgi:hypothetical protein
MTAFYENMIQFHDFFTTNTYQNYYSFIVPKVPTILRGNSEDNSWYRGDNKSAIARISSL